MTVNSDPPRVELRVRDLSPESAHDRPATVYEELAKLLQDGRISDVSVVVWGKQVRAEIDTNSATDDPITRAARSTYEEFREWAERSGHDLEPGFSTHTVGSLVDDEEETVIRFPVVCLAVYDGDELLAVAPCSTEEEVRTVDDCLEALQSGELTSVVVEASE